MLPVWRIAPRISRHLRLSCGPKRLYSSGEQTSGQGDFLETLKSYGGIKSIEGVQGNPSTNMPVSVARRVLAYAAEYQSEGPSVQGVQGSTSPHSGIGSIDGRKKILRQFLSEASLGGQPSRHFCSSVQVLSSRQGPQAHAYEDKGVEEDACPQGIQGDECVQFKLWLENCQRYHLPNCDEQVHAIETGRKTLADVFKEQQEIIREVAEAYKKQQEAQGSHDQGVQDSPYVCNFDLSEPCPQGLQGQDCINFKLWLYNCHQFGFGDCQERLNDVRSGRVSLSDIFEEQDELIRKVVMEHKQKQSQSTEVGNSDSKSVPSTPPVDTIDKLSQKERLKKAVREYGGTVIVFHVGISLISLGGFYLAVTR